MPGYDAGRFDPPAPLVQVGLRHPETGASLSGVPMLIDSGADVILIPLTCVNQIGAVVNSGEGYEVMGFDGSRSVVQAVHGGTGKSSVPASGQDTYKSAESTSDGDRRSPAVHRRPLGSLPD